MSKKERYYVTRPDGRRVSHYYDDPVIVMDLARCRATHRGERSVVRRFSDRRKLAHMRPFHGEKPAA